MTSDRVTVSWMCALEAVPRASPPRKQSGALAVSSALTWLMICCNWPGPRRTDFGLDPGEFRAGDLLDLALPEAGFDAVVCVFVIFLVPDMRAAARALWRLVRPRGKLTVTTWGPRILEPMSSRFWDAVGEVRSDLFRAFDPWDRISEPDAVPSMLNGAGIDVQEVLSESATQVLRSPEEWWPMVLGTDCRGTVEELDTEDRERVRRNNLDFIRDTGVTSVETNVACAVAANG